MNAQNEEIEALKLLCDSLRNENDKMLDNFTDDTTVQSLAKESKVYYSKFVDVKFQLEEAGKVIKQNDLIGMGWDYQKLVVNIFIFVQIPKVYSRI